MATRKTSAKAKPKAAAKKSAAAATASSKKPAAKRSAAAKAPAAKAKAKAKPAPNMGERMEGLQGWMAEIERKQGRMTKLGGAAAILAVLMSGGALALGIINQQNGASKDDVKDQAAEVNAANDSIKSDVEEQLKTLRVDLDAANTKVAGFQATIDSQRQEIDALKSQQQAAPTVGGQQNGLDVQPGVVTPPATPDNP